MMLYSSHNKRQILSTRPVLNKLTLTFVNSILNIWGLSKLSNLKSYSPEIIRLFPTLIKFCTLPCFLTKKYHVYCTVLCALMENNKCNIAFSCIFLIFVLNKKKPFWKIGFGDIKLIFNRMDIHFLFKGQIIEF